MAEMREMGGPLRPSEDGLGERTQGDLGSPAEVCAVLSRAALPVSSLGLHGEAEASPFSGTLGSGGQGMRAVPGARVAPRSVGSRVLLPLP